MKCKHDLKLLSPPVVDVDVSFLGSAGYFSPPIFQCTKCSKVFKTGYNENCLEEIQSYTLEEMKKEEEKYKLKTNRKQLPVNLIWLLTVCVGIAVFALCMLLIKLN